MTSIPSTWRCLILATVCPFFHGSSLHTDVRAAARTVLIVGTDNAPPYYFSRADGSIAGVAVDVLTRAAADLDFSLKFVHLTGVPDSFLDSGLVDLWPVLTITGERRGKYYMTEPWLFNTFCLLRASGGVPPEGNAFRLAHWTNPNHTLTAHRFFPEAQYLTRSTREDVMTAVCRDEADAGLIETRILDSLLLQRPRGCDLTRFLKQSVPGAVFPMGIAARKSAARQASALHRRITQMASSGELGKIFEKWSNISANEANSIVAMNAAEQKTRFAYAGLVLLLLGVGVVVVQFRRVRTAYGLARNEYAERRRAEEGRRAADRTRNTVLQGAGEGICGLDAEGRTTFVNNTALRLFGIAEAMESYDFHALVHGADLDGCPGSRCPLNPGHDGNVETRVRTDRFHRPDGSHFPVEFTFSPVMQEQVYTGAVVTFRDITSRRQAELLESDRNAILEMLAQNEALDDIFGAIARLAERQDPGLCCAITIVREPSPELRAEPSLLEIASSWSCPILSASNEILGTVRLYGKATTEPDSNQQSLLQIACRLAQLAIEQTRLTQQLHHQAHHDSLTGLPNRLMFEQRLAKSLSAARSNCGTVALFYIDLDRFKQINDTLSHRVGDLYLCKVAQRLQAVLPECATLARLGGDEFGVLLPTAKNPAEAETIARALLEAMAQPYSIDGYTVFGTASVGIGLSSEGNGAANLQSCADQAMYRAKGLGRNRFQFYSSDMSNCAIAQLETEHLIREAIAKRQFELFYQPQCRANGELVGFEALIRLRHPELGLVSPGSFIPVAEDTGLIVPIGAWVLHETCRQIAAWRAEGAPSVPVAINVSAAQFSQGNFAESVAQTVAEFHLAPSDLEIELTESMIMGNFDEALAQMTELRDLGVKLSIDDFGTGYSSLSYLHRLPIHTIKVDQSFVRAMDGEVSTRPLVEAIVAAARSLQCNVIAEGVETDEQRRELASMGCDHMQGYFFGRPLPAREALAPFLLRLAS